LAAPRRHGYFPDLSTPVLSGLACGVDAAVHSPPPLSDRLSAIADALQSVLDRPHLLSPAQRRSSQRSYRTHVLHVAADGSFSIVALVWLAGQGTPIHTHRSWCVVGVYEGHEIETTYRHSGSGTRSTLVPVATAENHAGAVSVIPGADGIHRVENGSSVPAISGHVYGLDYRRTGSSIAQTFDIEAGANHATAPVVATTRSAA
jgi:predicted metal-dependent enzyme (double-stranded beta helix superfamily)